MATQKEDMFRDREPARSLLACHGEILAISVAAVLLALLLEVRADDRVAFRGLETCPLPETCGCRTILGIPCPLCGLTRSFIHLAHGRFGLAWQSHHLGWLLAGVLLVQIPYRVINMQRGGADIFPPRLWRSLGACLIVLLLVNWILRPW